MSHMGQPSTPEIAGTRFSGEGSDRSKEGLVGRCEQGGQEAREEAAAFISSSQFLHQPPALRGSSQSQGTAFNTVFEKQDQTWAPTSIQEPLLGSPLPRLEGRPLPPSPVSILSYEQASFSCLTLVSAVPSA